MSTERDSRLQWIYASQGEAQLRERYDVWAADYDRDLDDLKWSAPQAGAERCAHFAKQGEEILDAGCGTGLVGVALAALGHTRIVGFDLSTGMLERSAERGVVSVGVFTLGHVDGSAFAELARVTAPGGHVSFTFRDDAVDHLGYRAEQQELIDSGVWELVDRTEPMALIHEDGEDIMLRVWTWRVQ